MSTSSHPPFAVRARSHKSHVVGRVYDMAKLFVLPALLYNILVYINSFSLGCHFDFFHILYISSGALASRYLYSSCSSSIIVVVVVVVVAEILPATGSSMLAGSKHGHSKQDTWTESLYEIHV